ncbi:MAG: hypothetical protein E5V46_03345 [Mesorhizobium sp.]|nr:MAG: hypothetical protein E5V46_03345 [Mesorhizobium sp.]
MPSIGEFTRSFAAITGTDFGSVLKIQRLLRDAGLLTSGARGVNAPDLTPLDAARMLIAILVTDKPSLAAAAVTEFGQLPWADNGTSETPTTEGAVFSGLTAAMSFEATLAGVIEGAAYSPLEHHDLLARNLRLSCIPTELTAAMSWRDGWSHFSAGGPWMHLLEDREGNADRLSEIVAEQDAARERAVVFSGYSYRIKTTREIGGDLLIDVSNLFRASSAQLPRRALSPNYELAG